MPRKPKRYWFTLAYFTAEGQPHPAHRHTNFAQVYGSLAVHTDHLKRVMTSELLRRGAYAAALWPGRLSERDALHSDVRPLLYVREGGWVEKL
jgi:hypothetical protein